MSKHNPSLRQVLGLGTAILLVAGNMIGSGVFKKITPISSELHNSSLILWAWTVAGLITMLGAFSFASLASTTKEAGGGNFNTSKMFLVAFWDSCMGGVFFTVISTASIASIAYVFAESLNALIPIPPILEGYSHYCLAGVLFPFQNASIKLIALSTLVLLTLFNIRGVEGGGWLSNLVTSAKILGIVLLIVVGLSYGGTPITPEVTTATTSPSDMENMLRISAFFTAMLGAFWAYDGWVNITNMASEFKNPTKNVPRAIIIGTALTMTLYLLVNYAYLHVLSPTDFAHLTAQEGKIAAVEVVNVAMGSVGVTIISLLIMISTFGATQASTMSAARVYYQMAKEGYFFKPFSAIHTRFSTPPYLTIGTNDLGVFAHYQRYV